MTCIWSGWEVQVQDASVAGLINELNRTGICLRSVKAIDGVTVQFKVSHGDIHVLRPVVSRRGSVLLRCVAIGVRPVVCRIQSRSFLVLSAFVLGLLLTMSNLFIWKIEVLGNEGVSESAVVRSVERAGVGVGGFWPAMDGVQLKHRVLLDMEQLQWVGLDYGGGVLKVLVRERQLRPKVVDNDLPVHIAAAWDGVITEITAKQGQCLVAEGDAVERGELLISGTVKSPIGSVRGVHALGTVQARTRRVITARQTSEIVKKQYTGRKNMKIAVIIGKNRINFSLGSSISPATCDKITMDYHLCMKDVLALPLCLVVERYEYWEPVARELDEAEQLRYGRETLMDTLERRLAPGGEVVSADFASAECGGGSTVTLAAECLEEIGKSVPVSEEELQGENTLGEDTTND